MSQTTCWTLPWSRDHSCDDLLIYTFAEWSLSHDHGLGVRLAELPAGSWHIVGALSRSAECINEFTEHTPAWKNHTSIQAAFKQASDAVFIFDFLLLCNF